MTTRADTQPTGRGHDLLTRWAYWMRGGLPGSSGEWSVQERIGPSRDIEPPYEAACVDRIVARIGRDFPPYRRMIKHFYLNDESYQEVAGNLEYTVGFVRLSMQAVADLVERRYDELNP